MILHLYHQQKYMFDNRKHTIEKRIVSISQPHVRPIVRGKTKAPTEFGAKVEISLANGYVRMENLVGILQRMRKLNTYNREL
ncbi:hypothetical protein ACN077_07785 [Clostridium chromiireducens]|uniref:hypothetical protein n=1 Tax=Clostridium chromiireducens TaxID=225345 RepID=UPI003AF82166